MICIGKTKCTSRKVLLPFGALNKRLKTQASEISSKFYENSLRLRVYNIRAKFSCHCRGTSKNSWANGLKRHLFARILEQKTNKRINFFFMSKRVQIIVI